MINWKALVAGMLTILVLGLIAQFAFLLTTTWIIILQNKQELEPQNAQILIYLSGFIYALITLAPGGYIAAMIAKAKVILHCAIIGTLATIFSLATSPDAEHATSFGLVFLILGVAMTIAGGMIWKQKSIIKVI